MYNIKVYIGFSAFAMSNGGVVMINIETYMSRLIDMLQAQFGERLVYVGLQGSYLRGEATPKSDIDVMVVIDGLTVCDLQTYRSIISSIGNFDRSCGFICSREDLHYWNRLELFNLLHGTKDYFGVLRDFLPPYTLDDIRSFIKMSVNNLYHEICHRYIHDNLNSNVRALPYTFKSVFYILQNLYYLRSGVFVTTKAELLRCLDGMDYDILKRSIDYNNSSNFEFSESFELLFTWCQKVSSQV